MAAVRKVCSVCGILRPSRNWIEKGWTTIVKWVPCKGRFVIYGCSEHTVDDLVIYLDAYIDGSWRPKEVVCPD